MNNENKIMEMLAKISSDIVGLREDNEQRFGSIERRLDGLESGQKNFDSKIDKVIEQLEDMEAKNIERHAEMQKLIDKNKTDIAQLQSIK